MRVRDIMTRIVVMIPEETSVEDAARMMRDHDVGMLPVGDRENVLGVITDRDITVHAAAESKDLKRTPVRDIMTTRPFHCFDDQDIEAACFLMEEKRIRRLLVFNRQRNLIGILSLDDVAAKTRKEKLTGYVLSKVAKAA